ncbi:MAG: hypothetical protein ACREGA_03795 [Candidatus Saccharimonadales bacterium]
MTKVLPKDWNVPLEKQTVYLPKKFRQYVRIEASRQNITISDYFINKIEEDLEDIADIKAIEDAKKNSEGYYTLAEFTELLEKDGII